MTSLREIALLNRSGKCPLPTDPVMRGLAILSITKFGVNPLDVCSELDQEFVKLDKEYAAERERAAKVLEEQIETEIAALTKIADGIFELEEFTGRDDIVGMRIPISSASLHWPAGEGCPDHNKLIRFEPVLSEVLRGFAREIVTGHKKRDAVELVGKIFEIQNTPNFRFSVYCTRADGKCPGVPGTSCSQMDFRIVRKK